MITQNRIDSFVRLLNIMDKLREKCPWDRVQTNESLRANTIEEVYELSDAILKNNDDDIKKELGDILLHVVFYSKIASEKASFDISDVCNSICEKLIFRHPHVFGDDNSCDSAESVEKSWEQIKLKEKDGNKTILGGVPSSLSSIIKAYRIQDKARNSGFDWKKKEDVWCKVNEELEELKEEIKQNNIENIESEFGDFIFSIINAARLYNINPDNALEKTNQKFISRFNSLEKEVNDMGKSFKQVSLDNLNDIWEKIKKQERL